MTKQTVIVGAGLAGLIAAHAFPRAQLYEAAPAPREDHKALLRFRSDAVSRLTGIPFRKVTVRKSIYHNNKHVAPNLQLANYYSQKLFGGGIIGPERSIWNLEPVERFVAPENFYNQLVDSVGSRCTWGAPFYEEDFEHGNANYISTMPLPRLLKTLKMEPPEGIEFQHAKISVHRRHIPDADAFQTIYFTDPDLSVYRASITKDLLIIEAMSDIEEHDFRVVLAAFGLPQYAAESTGLTTSQRYGKILPIDSRARKAMLFNLTHKHGIYSLGRFATWRNILLDDVVHDAKMIELMMEGDSYDLRRRTV